MQLRDVKYRREQHEVYSENDTFDQSSGRCYQQLMLSKGVGLGRRRVFLDGCSEI